LRQPASLLLCIATTGARLPVPVIVVCAAPRTRQHCVSRPAGRADARAAHGRALVALQEGGDVESAAILTPYTGQVRVIGNMLRQQKLDAQVWSKP